MTKRLYKVELGEHHLQLIDYPGEKGTIIALHGLTGTHKNMLHYAQNLQGDYRFIAIDLRGRGDSSGMDSAPSIFSHAQDVKDLIAVLGINEPILLGHSMGAYISAIVASEIPSVKGLILLDGAAQMSGRQHDIVRPSLGRLRKSYESKRAYVEELKQLYKRLGIKWTDAVQEIVEYEIHGTSNGWMHKSANENIEEDIASFDLFNPIEVMRKITCETLLIQANGEIGSFPPFFTDANYEETKKYTSKLTTFHSDCNHYTMVFEKRDDILAAIRDFLDGVMKNE
ncbi:alpha/beta hydrolase [Sporosarcina sp. ACRSL]|uniref:alpha/beta fold hydrolase n=1 Tax=Sporosarcina sp. ACRSL TaxID=2918215 RepID=UPI001EF4C21E|nr:alpha/beta hydrolase [Sporosarcina sp. ACRSL]MCG7343666.1 alpha/beta hydrolase [Sporosarcina sp. ACRSL]